MDTGAGFNVIRSSALPDGWEDKLIPDCQLPNLGDANGKPLQLRGAIQLRVRFKNTIFTATFIVADKLAVDVILGTCFMNKNVKAIECMTGKIVFQRNKTRVPILDSRTGSPIEMQSSEKKRTEGAQSTGTSSNNLQTSHVIRLSKRVTIPALSQLAVKVSTPAGSLVFIEPKNAIFHKHQVRTANGVADVMPNVSFDIVVANFSRKPKSLPKNTVIGYATRDPLGCHSLGKRVGEEFMKVLCLPFTEIQEEKSAEPCNLVDENEKPTSTSTPESKEPEDDSWREKVDLSHLEDEELRERVYSVLAKYKDLWKPGKLGCIKATEHRIDLVEGTKPIHQMPYRQGLPAREKTVEIIKQVMDQDVIEPAMSEWASPVVFAPKKDGTTRFCVDYRRLNAVTKPDVYPLPRMDDCLDSLGDAMIFTTLDAHDIRPFMIDTDASNYQLGAALLQQKDEKNPTEWLPVGFFSKTLNETEQRYSATERECFAVLWSVLYLRPYIEGSHFKIRTDHEALRWLMTLTDPSGRLTGWRLRLSEFDYEVTYRPGRVHQVPNALSRISTSGTDNSPVDDEIPSFNATMVVTRSQAMGATQSIPQDIANPSEARDSHSQDNRAEYDSNDNDDIIDLPLWDGETPDDMFDEELDGTLDEQADVFDLANVFDDDGTQPRVADTPLPITRAEVLEAQKSDDFCQTVLSRQSARKDSKFFEDGGGLLRRKNPHHPDYPQIVLPASLRPRLLSLALYHKLSGHPGQTRTYYTMRQRFYWPYMAADIQATVRNCHACAKNRIRLRKRTNPMQLFPATEPLRHLCIDILGPLKKTKRNFRWILVITDRFTKLTQVISMKKVTAQHVAIAFVEHWVFKYGPPKTLLSDNGSNFASNCSREYVDMQELLTSTHPHITLKPMVKLRDTTEPSWLCCVITSTNIKMIGISVSQL